MADFPILQFGTSRFLQAHADLFVSDALPRGEAIGRIAVVGTTASPASRQRVKAFAQGQPYPVQIKGLANGALIDDVVQVGSVGAGVDANDAWAEVERLFCAARVVISNTGDRGYELDPADALADAPPKSFPAKIAKLLVARHRAGAPPLTLLPCELTPENGAVLRGIVGEVLQSWTVPQAVQDWAREDCKWANSLVDRIVSTPLEPLGAIAEPYALWAIEAQPGLDLPCHHDAIVLTDDLARYERLKLFILNLGHTFLAQVWKARGGRADLTVREAMQDPHLRPPLDALYDEDVLPIFAALGMGEEAAAYRKSVVERFSNPFLDHRFVDIYINHTAKARRRFGGLVALAESQGLKVDLKRLKALLAAAS